MPAVELTGPGIGLAGGVPQRPGHVTHRRAGSVGDDVGHLGGVVAAMTLIDVGNDLGATTAFDVNVDVGWTVTFGRQEAFEQQAQPHGIHIGDPDGVTHRGVGGAPPTLAVDVVGPAEVHDVRHHQEVAGEPQLVDDGEFVVQLGPGTSHRRIATVAVGPWAIPPCCTGINQPTEIAHLVETIGARERRQRRSNQRQVKGAGQAQLAGPFHHTGPTGESPCLLGSRAQVGGGRRRKPAIEFVQAATGSHCRHRRSQSALSRCGVMGIGGSDQISTGPHRHLGQSIVAGAVEGLAVIPQLHGHMVRTKGTPQSGQLVGCRRRPEVFQRHGHRPLATPGQYQPMTLIGSRGCCATHRSEVGHRGYRGTLGTAQLRLAHCTRQQCVPPGVTGQHYQMVVTHGDLGSQHRWQSQLTGGGGKADRAIKTVVVGDRQRIETQPHRFHGQLFGR